MATGVQVLRSGAAKYISGVNNTGALTLTDLAVLTISADKVYRGLNMQAHCRTGAIFELYYNDNGSISSLDIFIGAEAGHPTPEINDPNFILDTSGKSGTQELILRFKNFAILNCCRGKISTEEFDV